MNRAFWFIVLLPLFMGCHSDIVTTKHLKAIKNRCVYIEPIESQDPYVGKVIRDVFEKEFVRKGVRMCDAKTANIVITGSTFMTVRSSGKKDWFGGKDSSAQSIESLTIAVKDKAGNVLITASYDNREQYTASKLGQEFGKELADRLM